MKWVLKKDQGSYMKLTELDNHDEKERVIDGEQAVRVNAIADEMILLIDEMIAQKNSRESSNGNS